LVQEPALAEPYRETERAAEAAILEAIAVRGLECRLVKIPRIS
jgi:hypothetical protein